MAAAHDTRMIGRNMNPHMSSRLALVLASIGFAAGATAIARDAAACGGVFVPSAERPSGRQLVRDHRIAMAIGRSRTVIWDEVRFDGSPRELAWVSPVLPGTKIELASAEWLDALETSTQPIIYAPREQGFGGCALTGCAESDDSFTVRSSPGGGVVVLNESIVGPYESVTIRSQADADAPLRWLTQNGYDVAPEVRPVLHAYAEAGFDFAALRIRPSCTGTKMRPIRMVVPSAAPRVLLRMALAGASRSANVTLFALAETPYRPASMPHARLDDDALVWSFANERSSYDLIAEETMAREGGRTWLIEASKSVLPQASDNELPVPTLAEAYDQLCKGALPGGPTPEIAPSLPPCEDHPTDGGLLDGGPEIDGGDADASDPDAGGLDAGAGDGAEDASVPDSGGGEIIADGAAPATPGPHCKPSGLNDHELMRDVVGTPNVFVTRMRARIPPAVLTADLDLAPAPSDSLPITNLHQALREDRDDEERPDKSACTSSRRRDPVVTWGPGAAAIFALTLWLRRRARA